MIKSVNFQAVTRCKVHSDLQDKSAAPVGIALAIRSGAACFYGVILYFVL